MALIARRDFFFFFFFFGNGKVPDERKLADRAEQIKQDGLLRYDLFS